MIIMIMLQIKNCTITNKNFSKWTSRVEGCENVQKNTELEPCHKLQQWRTEGGGGGCQTRPPPEIPKALQNRAKLKPIVKTVKNYWI